MSGYLLEMREIACHHRKVFHQGRRLGDILETKVERGAVVFRPKVLRDRDEFLRELRKDVEASEAAVKAGRVLGPFDNADDAARAFKQFKKQRRAPARPR